MKFEKFTVKAQEALATAQQIAMAKSHTMLTPLHLLSVMVGDDEGIVVLVLKKIGANVEQIKAMTESELNRLPQGLRQECMCKSALYIGMVHNAFQIVMR